MSDYTEKNSNLIPQIDIPCFAWNSQAEQGFLFFKAKSLCICKDKTYTQRKITAHHVPNEKKHLLSPFDAEKADVFLSEAGTISLPLPISVSVLFC